MRIDEKEFFQQAILRLCSTLLIEQALWKCLLYIRDFVPVEEVFLHYFDVEGGASVIFAKANEKGGKQINVQAPWPPELLPLATKGQFPNAFLSNRADENPMAKPMLDALHKGKSSAITIRLTLEDNWIGGVSFWTGGWDRFNKAHKDLLSSLRQPFAIALSNSRRYQEIVKLKELLADDNQYLRTQLRQISGTEIIGADFGLKSVMEMVRQVAPIDSPVLLRGETGSGKEVIANAIHELSHRRTGPFITVNCGGIPETLIDSELFGHENGAFTGAVNQKRGRFERADHGTLFLDEIGELPLDAQVRLLRVLQEKEIERIGGTSPIKLDIRIIAATHRDLESMVKHGRFREDLYFRIQVFPIMIPPLRARTGDIPALVHYFIQKKSIEMNLPKTPALAPAAMENVIAYHWPGNIRELENAVERALILNQGPPLTFSDLHSSIYQKIKTTPDRSETEELNLDQTIKKHINKVLLISKGRIEGKNGAAKILGVNPGTLRHRMRKLGIRFGRGIK